MGVLAAASDPYGLGLVGLAVAAWACRGPGSTSPRCSWCRCWACAAGKVDNGVGVDDEEQGDTIWICREPVAPWSQLWPALRHHDT